MPTGPVRLLRARPRLAALALIVVAVVVGTGLGFASRPPDDPTVALASPDPGHDAGPTSAPTATRRPTAIPSPTAHLEASATPDASTSADPASPAPTPKTSGAPLPPRTAASYLLLTPAEIMRLPASGAAWDWVVEVAGRSATPKLSAQDSEADIVVFARALVFVRTGDEAMRTSVVKALKAVVGTEKGGRTLALGRNLPGFVLAADLIDLRSADPAFDKNVFRPWLRSLFTKVLDGATLVSTAEGRPNNWGTHAGAARVAVARYLGDAKQLARQAKVFRGWLGDRSAYAGFTYGDLSWQCDPARPVGINPVGCTRDGHSLDGVQPDDQRRGGDYTWPPPKENYAWEALQGAILQAELLYQAGHAAWSWEDKALLRAVTWLVEEANYPANGDDRWQQWLIDARYRTSFHGSVAQNLGKNFAFTEWLYAP